MTNRKAANDLEFATVRAASQGGDTIELTGSNYAAFTWSNVYGGEVKVFPTNPANPPLISGRTHLNGCQNVRFDDIRFDRPYTSGDGNQVNTIEIDNAVNVSIYRGEIMGGIRTSDGAYNGRGLAGANCVNLVVEGVKFHTLYKGYTGNASPARFSWNEFTAIRSDGMTLGGSDDVTVEFNYYHDFQTLAGSGAHPDLCQIQRSSGIGMNRFIFRYNVMDVGDGNFCQGLFSGDSGEVNTGVGTVVRHTEWQVYHNLIMVDHANDMVFTWVDDLHVYNNATIRIEAGNNSGTESGITCFDCTNVRLDDNVAGSWPTGPEFTNSGNVQVLIADWPTQFNVLKATNRTDPAKDDGYHDFEIKAGGSLHTANVGPWIMKREGGWGGNGINPHPAYPGGFGGAVAPPTLPAGSVAADITVA